MKTFNSIVGAIITSTLTIGVLFKTMHWPFGGILLILSSAFLLLYMVPVAIANVRSYEGKVLMAFCNGFGAFIGMILVTGLLFKIQHWPGSSIMMIIGMSLGSILAFVFMVMYIVSKEPIKLSSGTFFISVCIGLLFYAVSVGGSSRNILRNITLNAIGIQSNIQMLKLSNKVLNERNGNEKAIAVYEKTEELNVHIHDLRTKLYEITDKITNEVADTISLTRINSLDNYDEPTRVLGLADPGKPLKVYGLEKYSAITLREKIEEFYKVVRQADPNILGINTTIINYYNGGPEFWETTTFYHMSLAGVVLTLNQIQANANVICNEILIQETKNKLPNTTNQQ